MKLWCLFLCKFWVLLLKISFWSRDCGLASVSTQVLRPEVFIQLFGNLWRNSNTKFIILDMEFRFTSGKSNLHGKTVNCENMSQVVGSLFYIFAAEKCLFCLCYLYSLKLKQTPLLECFCHTRITITAKVTPLYHWVGTYPIKYVERLAKWRQIFSFTKTLFWRNLFSTKYFPKKVSSTPSLWYV